MMLQVNLMMLALKSGPQIAAKVGNPAGLLCRRIWYSVGKSGVLGITEYRQGRPLGRTSVCRRITPFLDQRINAKFAKSMSASACLPTGRKRRRSFSPRTQAWHCVSLVNTDDS